MFILYQIHCPNRCFLSTSSSPLIFPPLSLPVAEEPLESGQMHFVKVAMQSSPLQAESGWAGPAQGCSNRKARTDGEEEGVE